MRGLPLLFALRLRRTWNTAFLLFGMGTLVALTYVDPRMDEQSLLWILYVAGLLSLQVFGQLRQLQAMPFARMLPRRRQAEAGTLALLGLVLAGLVAVWQATVPHPLPLPAALGTAIVGYAVGMNPWGVMTVLLGAMAARQQYIDYLLGHPWLMLAASLIFAVCCLSSAARGVGLLHPGDFRNARTRSMDLRGWRAGVAAVLLRRTAYRRASSGHGPWVLADALVYEDAGNREGLRSVLRRWWTLPAVMLVCLGMVPLLHLSAEDYGFLVLLGTCFVFYIGSKLNVIVPQRHRLYPVSRRLLLHASWLAHVRRMLGLALLWGATLGLFCAAFRHFHPNAFGDMAPYYPIYLAAIGTFLLMPVAQGFAVHYGGDYNQQATMVERRFLRSLIFTVCELATIGVFVVLLVKGLFWPPFEVVGVLALLIAVTQGVLFLCMRRDLLRGDLA